MTSASPVDVLVMASAARRGDVVKEALLSSQIEGTQATFVDLLEFEAEDVAGCHADIRNARRSVRAAGAAS